MMRYGVAYQKQSEEEFVIEHRKRMEKQLHRTRPAAMLLPA